MTPFWKTLAISVLALTCVLVLVFALIWLGFGYFGLPLLIVLCLLYFWMLTAYFHYRYGRQEEFLHLLTTAAQLQAPLAPTLWAYLRDRPRGGEREFWVAGLLFFVLPGYYWLWHRQHSFDAKIAKVALQLEMGMPLSQALRNTPGVATREAGLAAAVGQATGKLAQCLNRAARGRLTTVWLEAIPRVIYPIALLWFLGGITVFWMLFVFPKMQVIFRDFKMQLPAVTQQVANIADTVDQYRWAVSSVIAVCIALIILLMFNSSVRWFCPGVAFVYRMNVRSRVLRMLGILLDAGKPAPEALAILAESGFFKHEVRRRLRAARQRVERGTPLASALHGTGLLPAAMAPLVQSAERARHLPWALAELGEHLSSRAARLAQRVSMALSPAAVAAIGVFIGVMVVGMFVPLVKLLEGVAQ